MCSKQPIKLKSTFLEFRMFALCSKVCIRMWTKCTLKEKKDFIVLTSDILNKTACPFFALYYIKQPNPVFYQLSTSGNIIYKGLTSVEQLSYKESLRIKCIQFKQVYFSWILPRKVSFIQAGDIHSLYQESQTFKTFKDYSMEWEFLKTN